MAVSRWTEATGELPRLLNPNLLWAGGCQTAEYNGELAHGHLSLYVIKGERHTLMIDTGHPMHWHLLEKQVEEFLGSRPLDYIFPTHAEMPHAGLFAHWLDKYPDAVALGDLDDYDMYYPRHADRMRNVKVGDELDLGGRSFFFVPAIWRDLRHTLWGFDTLDKVLFVSDGFAHLHLHRTGECDHVASERELPSIGQVKFFNERALHWSKFLDSRPSFPEIDRLISDLGVRMLATAHGGVIDAIDEWMPVVKSGLLPEEHVS